MVDRFGVCFWLWLVWFVLGGLLGLCGFMIVSLNIMVELLLCFEFGLGVVLIICLFGFPYLLFVCFLLIVLLFSLMWPLRHWFVLVNVLVRVAGCCLWLVFVAGVRCGLLDYLVLVGLDTFVVLYFRIVSFKFELVLRWCLLSCCWCLLLVVAYGCSLFR